MISFIHLSLPYRCVGFLSVHKAYMLIFCGIKTLNNQTCIVIFIEKELWESFNKGEMSKRPYPHFTFCYSYTPKIRIIVYWIDYCYAHPFVIFLSKQHPSSLIIFCSIILQPYLLLFCTTMMSISKKYLRLARSYFYVILRCAPVLFSLECSCKLTK